MKTYCHKWRSAYKTHCAPLLVVWLRFMLQICTSFRTIVQTKCDTIWQGKVGCRDVNTGIWKQERTFSQQTSQHMKHLFIQQQTIASQLSLREQKDYKLFWKLFVSAAYICSLYIFLFLCQIFSAACLITCLHNILTTSSKELVQILTWIWRNILNSGFKRVYLCLSLWFVGLWCYLIRLHRYFNYPAMPFTSISVGMIARSETFMCSLKQTRRDWLHLRRICKFYIKHACVSCPNSSSWVKWD